MSAGSVATRPMLEIDDVSVVYPGGIRAVRGVSMSCPDGSVTLVLGPNGAGKTSLTRAVTGFLPSEQVKVSARGVRFASSSILRMTPHARVRRGMAYVPERVKVFASMTVEENLRLACGRSDFAARRDEALEVFPVLAPLAAKRAGLLSGGERQMLALSRALMSKPRMLVIDELSLGLAPRLTESLLEAVGRVNREQGMTILLVEQAARAALTIADHVVVMRHGEVSWQGPAADMNDDSTFERVYLHADGEDR